MKLWQLAQADGGLVAYIPNAEFLHAFGGHGTDVIAIRRALESFTGEIIDLQVAKPSASAVESVRQTLPDMLVWSWIPIFSERVVNAMTDAGCLQDEFWRCRFDTNPDAKYFFHLPGRRFDIVDFVQTEFKMYLPLDPPFPLFIKKLVTLPIDRELPPCFRAGYPGKDAVLSELFVRHNFKLTWEEHGFTGGVFSPF